MNADIKRFILQHKTEILTKDYKSMFEEASIAGLGGLVENREIFIPKSVTYFGYNAFAGCSNLTKVTYEGTEHNLERLKIMFDHPESIEFVLE